MSDTTGFTSPDDDGAEDALAEAERIVDGASGPAADELDASTRNTRTTRSPRSS